MAPNQGPSRPQRSYPNEERLRRMATEGMDVSLESQHYLDKYFGCEGIWLDKGELEILQTKETGFVGRMLSIFR